MIGDGGIAEMVSCDSLSDYAGTQTNPSIVLPNIEIISITKLQVRPRFLGII